MAAASSKATAKVDETVASPLLKSDPVAMVIDCRQKVHLGVIEMRDKDKTRVFGEIKYIQYF